MDVKKMKIKNQKTNSCLGLDNRILFTNSPKYRKPKHSQITIFIIIAIVLVIGIFLIIFLIKKPYVEVPEKLDLRIYIDKCTREAVENSIEKILKGGGKIDPELFILYKGEKHIYLCYQENNYFPCINQQPLLKNIAEIEIKQDSESRIRQCFDSLKSDLEEKGFSVSEGNLDYNIDIIPEKIQIKINKKFDILKGESSQSFESFDTKILSPLYGLIDIAREIVKQESLYCYSAYDGIMMLYPQYNIKRIAYDDSRIYLISDRKTGKEFKFAVRGCATPAGLF